MVQQTILRQYWQTERTFAAGQGSSMTVRVKCLEQAGDLEGDSVDYAVALSMWVGPTVQVDVYSQVRDQIRSRVSVRPGG
ncbi:hypothetical protein KCMC57_up47820 [Kitasatospora sp. CMC57]